MRAILVLALAGACTPDVVPGSYFCGENAACPEDQKCNLADNTCVLPGLVRSFACEQDVSSEPDDSLETGYMLMNIDCTTLPVVINGCMPSGDSADWYRLSIPGTCGAVSIDTRITFPVAFQRLGVQLVDTSNGSVLATDTACQFSGESGDDLRCVAASLTAGVTYAIGVAPTGAGDCDGDCAFTRYTLRAQLK